jgi:probable DNA metabolism protein
MVAAVRDAEKFLPPGFAHWRSRARSFLILGIPPHDATWGASQLSLPVAGTAGGTSKDAVSVPRRFLRTAVTVACHRDPERWDLLYRVLWRVAHGERQLLSIATDPDVHRLWVLEKAVRRAAHKMKAFVRFRRVRETDSDADRYVAWFEPMHHVVERTAPFFARRFATMRWSILTPDRTAHWDGTAVTFGPGVPRPTALVDDGLEDLWREYYASTFNPARLASGVMRAEMPKGYWKNLPEARLIPELARSAPARVAAMVARIARAPDVLPDELRAEQPLAPLRRGVARSALDLPSWDPVYDPGVVEARDRHRALPEDSAVAFCHGRVTVMAGVAGWTDPTLLAPGVFYPDDATTPEARLRFYAGRYAMVEVDSTYYALPRREHAVAWVRRTPERFVFNIKAHALMTGHAADLRRMPDWLRRAVPRHASTRVYGRELSAPVMEELWQRFLAALEPLRTSGKLGAIFLQFPRWFEPTPKAEQVLQDAARRLGSVRGAVEFRNPAWVQPGPREARTLALLTDCRLAYTVVDAPPGTPSSMPPIVRVTRPDFAVVRLHGRRVSTWEARNPFVTERYRYLYTHREIDEWARRVAEMTQEMHGGLAMISFNNNHANYATTNAAEFGHRLRADGASTDVRHPTHDGADLTPEGGERCVSPRVVRHSVATVELKRNHASARWVIHRPEK